MASTERTKARKGRRTLPSAAVTLFVGPLAALAFGSVLVACGSKANEARAPERGVAAIEEFLPELSNLDVCRNALDDNDSGFIDEGCAEGRGSRLEFYLAWPESGLSLDLWVTGPDGGVAEVGRETKAGLVKLLDCPEESGCQGQNYEKVILERERELSFGRYRIVVEAPTEFPEARSYPFTLGVVDRRVTRAYRGSIGPLERRVEMDLEIFESGRAPAMGRVAR